MVRHLNKQVTEKNSYNKFEKKEDTERETNKLNRLADELKKENFYQKSKKEEEKLAYKQALMSQLEEKKKTRISELESSMKHPKRHTLNMYNNDSASELDVQDL